MEKLGEEGSSSEKLMETGEATRVPLVSIAVPSLKLYEDLKDAKAALDSFGVESEVCIVAAHWAPKKTLRFIAEIDSKGVEVIIAAADGSAHLPGMIASLTTMPVIGVPLRGTSLDGLDSLLSIVQMPLGVPVGTMAINSAYNAGVYACQILSLKYPHLRDKLKQHKELMEEKVETEDANHKRSSRPAKGGF
ncbi:5-(carboxyamino)imidazole ribonucleotide mutase [Nitrososphaera sp.]|uniref:5-(carboxyamino)imidazole ribonucleotide mutase n=1 Tax=Nitrososphaera sp. TaxID=1971748 RepID=UPI002EDBB62D